MPWLGFFVVVGIPVIIGVVVWGTTLIFNAGKKGQTKRRLRELPMHELREAGPAPLTYYDPTKGKCTVLNLYRTEVEAWFEVLFERTFQEPEGFNENYQALTEAYVALLSELKLYLQRVEIQSWDRIEDGGHIVPQACLGYTVQAIEWLERLAQRQSGMAEGYSVPLWDAPLLHVQKRGGFTVTCTPDAIQRERDRISHRDTSGAT